MFDIAWSEFLVVAVVALVVVGPKDLPALLRTVGRTISSLKRMAGEFQGQFNEAMREAELDDLKNDLTGMKDKASRMIGASPFQIARDEIKNALTDKPKTPSALAGDAEGAAKAEVPADAPSALAPPPPSIEPTPEPPAPTAADFGIKAAPAMRPVEPKPTAQPAAAKTAARKAASGASAEPSPATKPAPRKRAPANTAPAKTASAETAPTAEAPKPAKPRKAPAKKKTEPTPPGASA